MTDYAYAISDDLVDENIQLQYLYLDPNNPRFVGSRWTEIPDSEIDSDTVQENASRKLKDRFDVGKLRLNMEINGYLPIDRVVVREIKENTYVVLEGNRRICAAKELFRVAARDDTIPEDIRESVNIIPCLLYTGDDPMAAWTFQGLRHISGINDWPAFNKAKLLVTQMEDDGLSLTDVGKRFGLSAFGAGQWVRGYFAFMQAIEESDYTEEIDEKSYPFFQELFGRSSIPIREWLDWDHEDYQFVNFLRFNEFVGWLYPKPEDQELEGSRGIWEDRRLSVRDDLRRLSYILRNNRDAFEEFRRGEVEIESAYSKVLSRQYEQSIDRQDEVFNALEVCKKALEELPFKMLTNDDTKGKLLELLNQIRNAIAAIEDASS